jgi:hypothetical protein
MYKAKSHKYTHKRRVYIKGKPAWRYFYKEHHGGGVTNVKDIKEGEAFKVKYKGKEGHFKVLNVEGDKVTVVHDETGKETTLSKSELRQVLLKTHAKALKANIKEKEKRYKRAKQDLESAKKQAGIEESNFKAVSKEERKEISKALIDVDQAKTTMLENKIDFDGMGIANPKHYKLITELMSKTKDESNREIGHIKKTFKTNDPKMIKEALKTLDFKHFFGSSVYEHNANYQNLRIEIKDRKELEFTFDNYIQVNASAQKDPPAPMDTDAGDKANEEVKNQPPQERANQLMKELESLIKSNPTLAQDPRILGLLGTQTKTKPKTEGKESTMFIYGTTPPEEQKVKYRLIEAGDAIPSHNAVSFGVNKDYPEGVQERAYHTDKHGQYKVIHQAQTFKSEYMINTNPDAVNGAPIIMEDGTVLGGNSRTMSLQRVYAKHPEKAKEYKDTLKSNASAFGFNESDIDAMKAPMLVRVYEPKQKDKKSLQVISRALNENKTASMDARLLGRSQASRLTDQTLKTISESIKEGQTLNHFLSRPSKELGNVVQNLLNDGILTQLNSVQYIKKDGSFNGTGKDYIENLLVGSVIRDINILEDLNYDTYQNLAVAVGQLAGAGLGDAQKTALQDAVAIYNSGIKSGYLKMKQQTAKERMNAMRLIMEQQQDIEYKTGKGEINYTKIKEDIKKNPLSNAFLYILTASTSTKKVRENIKAFISHTQEEENEGFSFFARDPLSFEDSAMKVIEDIQREDKSGLRGAGGLFKSIRRGLVLYSF